ncbi:hypothetical protein RSOLAG22IIIB_04018 [Rhizoctonia solani]|uniref:Uncharacterized protein n=1 Tax=Rhizoctonia solani TaxID=456999 RepID=A0A0K6FUB4_9AGAM|nr:hypothetical protein RSOLAG22IIIB_04018 [Rhizoctonia solani]
MAALTAEDQGEGRDILKRQKCDNGVPVSTRYEVSTITTYFVSHSDYISPTHSTDPPPETPRPTPTSWSRYTFRDHQPATIPSRTSTTWLPPKKSVVSTTSEVIPKPRAIQAVPVTITRTIVTRVPVETVYSCPLRSAPEPLTSRHDDPTSRSSRVPPTSREPPTSHTPPSSWIEPTSRSMNTTETYRPPSTSHRPMTSSREPWYPSSSMPSTPSSRSRPTEAPSTSPPPITLPTSSVRPHTSSAPNSTTTYTWPPTTTSPPYSECVYTLFDGTVPYGNYTASCTSSTMSGSWCSVPYRSGGWELVPCTSTYTNTSSILTNTTTPTQTITSWPCRSYVPGRETWVGVSCTSSINTTSSTWPCSSYVPSLERWVPASCTSTSSIERCSSYLGSRSGWAAVPCTSTQTITTAPTVTTTPTLTHSRSCSTYVEDLKTWLPMPCNTITTVPTSITTPTIIITPNVTVTPTITEAPITDAPTITRRPITSYSRYCNTYIPELDLWLPAPCTTASPAPLMCFNEDLDTWIPCASVSRTSDTDTSSHTITETSNTRPIFITNTRTPYTPTRTHLPQTLFPTGIDTELSLTVEPTQTQGTETHTLTQTRPPHQSSVASISTSDDFTLTSSENPGSSPVVKPSSTRRVEYTSTREPQHTPQVHPTTTRNVETTLEPTHSSVSSPLAQSPSSQRILTSSFTIPTGGVVTFPSPSSTITPIPSGIRSGTLAGIIVGSIIGVVGLLGLAAFLMKSFSGNRGHDLFGPRGGYQAAAGGSIGGRDDGGNGNGNGGGAGGSSGMSENRNDSPLRSALRNRNMVSAGGWSDASWNPAYAYTGVAVAAAAAATTANNQRGRQSEPNGRYADGGIRDEDTPDAVPRRYADGGLAGPDSHYDAGTNNHPYGNQDLRQPISRSEVQFDPYHDLPVHQDPVPVGPNITRQSAYSSAGASLSPSGPAPSYHSTPGNLATGYPNLQLPQIDTGVFLSTAGGISTTSFAASSIDQPTGIQPPAPNNVYQNSPPHAYAGNNGIGGVATYQSQPFVPSDIQRPPYWESSIAAASVDSLPQHGNIPRYSAFTDAGNSLGVGSSSALGFNNAAGIGSPPAPALALGTGSMGAQSPSVVSPTWNPVGVTEFGQTVIGSFSAQADPTTCISDSGVPDAPRNLHQGLTRLSTELASTEGRDIDSASPRSASRASARPPRVSGPRMRPPRTPTSMSRLDSRRSLPPAYEERQIDP